MRDYSQADRIILTAFSRAHKEGELQLEVENYKAAVALRARAYAVAKTARSDAAREHASDVDIRMGQVVGDVMIQLGEKGAGRATISFRRKDTDPALQALAAAVGTLIDPVAEAAAESMEKSSKLLEELSQSDARKRYLGEG